MERIRQFVSSVLAGMMIGIGGTVYLSQSDPVTGSFLFSIGLLTILVFQFHLFTGKIGYLPFQGTPYLIELGITWGGNLVGTSLAALMVRNSRIYGGIAEKAQAVAEAKLADGCLSILLLAVFCGMLMFIAVDTFKTQQGSALRAIGVILPIMVFILSGFEHVIANMYYFSLTGVWNDQSIVRIIVMTVGNSVGGILIPCYMKAFRLR